jgi:uncharacterized protein
MTAPARTDIRLDVSERVGSVPAILLHPPDAWILYVLAHGAGAGMHHSFLESLSASLAERGVATLRYQFPYMEAGRKRPDVPAVLESTVRAAVALGQDVVPKLPVIAGGKSLGGRMTSSAAAAGNLDNLRGLAFLGFPLHAPGQPGTSRAAHLVRVTVPMLFLQGTRDAFAQLDLITGVCTRLGSRAMLHLIDHGDHSFDVLQRSGRTRADVLAELSGTLVDWAHAQVLGRVPA